MESSPATGRTATLTGLWIAGVFSLSLLGIYFDTVRSMVMIWSRSETFAHGFLILPITLWLIWDQRGKIPVVGLQPAWWPLVAIAPLGLLWLSAWLVEVAVIKQLALVAMLITGIWAILGHGLGRLLLFPLFFLFFAVPIGEGLIAPMMEYTATSTVWLIEMTGIPVYREGLNFALPSGRWSVVEACSGVRYIIASVTVGTLYAYLTYRSWSRRIIFVVISAIVPVLANSARAYIIVMLGHYSNMTIATGADHLVYGWVFFGVVIFVLFWLGSFFREDLVDETEREGDQLEESTGQGAPVALTLGVACCALLLAAAAPVLTNTIFSPDAYKTSDLPGLPTPQRGWVVADDTRWSWRPPARLAGEVSRYFKPAVESGEDTDVVGLYVQFVDGSVEGAEVVGSSSLFALEDTGYIIASQEKVSVTLPGGEIPVDEALVRGDGEVLAWSWYRVGEHSTSNKYDAKLRELLASLGLSPTTGTYRIVVATSVGESLSPSRKRLQTFLDVHAASLYGELSAAAAEISND